MQQMPQLTVYVWMKVNEITYPETVEVAYYTEGSLLHTLWLNGLVVNALGIRTRGLGFESQVAPLFH